MDQLINASKRRSLNTAEQKELEKLLDEVFLYTVKRLESSVQSGGLTPGSIAPRRRRTAKAA